MASGVGVLGATASLVTAIVVLFFVQLFHLAGVDVRQQPHGRRRWFSRQALLDETVDAAVDVADLLD